MARKVRRCESGLAADDEELPAEDLPEDGHVQKYFESPQGPTSALRHAVGKKSWNDLFHLIARHAHDFGERSFGEGDVVIKEVPILSWEEPAVRSEGDETAAWFEAAEGFDECGL